MRLPVIQGIIRRRILANFRVDPETMQREIPSRFQPKLQNGKAVAGVCLIRLEHIRPRLMPEIVGLNSENAAHRVAVTWNENGVTREGVFISRRDTGSQFTHLAGGRIFPGEHHHASFEVTESENEISLTMNPMMPLLLSRSQAELRSSCHLLRSSRLWQRHRHFSKPAH